ncbi:MAG: hypothetical protein R2856_35410 [Caldilineaceae bacterium]
MQRSRLGDGDYIAARQQAHGEWEFAALGVGAGDGDSGVVECEVGGEDVGQGLGVFGRACLLQADDGAAAQIFGDDAGAVTQLDVVVVVVGVLGAAAAQAKEIEGADGELVFGGDVNAI